MRRDILTTWNRSGLQAACNQADGAIELAVDEIDVKGS